MRKVLLIAKRDYLQTVSSKAFLFGLILLPLILGIGFLAISLSNKGNVKEQRIAVIDRTGVSSAGVIQACEESNRRANAGSTGGLRVKPHYAYEEIGPEPDAAAQLLSLADRVRRGEIYLVLDIPADALNPPPGATQLVRYYSNATGVSQLSLWLPAAVNDGLRRVRLVQAGVAPAALNGLLQEVSVVAMNLPSKDSLAATTGLGEKRSAVQSELMPLILVVLLVMVVMIGSAPNLGAVAEDKVQRVFEMLLVSASPFELIAGKVLAALGASLTSTVFYFIGGLFVLLGLSMFGLAPLDLLPWFFLYLIVDVLMMAALGVALGSACGSAQDAQQLASLLFMPIFVPMLMLTPIMQQPNGAFATAMSLIPPFTPVLMLLRQSLPGGVPAWQPWLGLSGMIVYAFCVIWAAARIFRIGILSQGKTPGVAELVQWVIHG
jgi:ABC-2 type transport system permease protein